MKKAQKNSLDREGLLKMAWKFLIFLGENGLESIGKSKIIESWWMISIAHVKLSNLPAKLNERILKNFKKIVRFFDQNLYGKLTFLKIFY